MYFLTKKEHDYYKTMFLWLDLIGMILIAGAIKLNLSEACTPDVCAVASIDLCLPVSVTSTKDTELKLKQNIYLRTNDVCIETKIFTNLQMQH